MSKKSVVFHAIKTNHFPEATCILRKIWKRIRAGLPGIHFEPSDCTSDAYATNGEICMMRGWGVNYPDCFSFTATHDLCDATFTRAGMERMVRAWYAHELEERIEQKREYERRHPEIIGLPCAGKRLEEVTLDEFIFEY